MKARMHVLEWQCALQNAGLYDCNNLYHLFMPYISLCKTEHIQRTSHAARNSRKLVHARAETHPHTRPFIIKRACCARCALGLPNSTLVHGRACVARGTYN
jgi:hypothetical protein